MAKRLYLILGFFLLLSSFSSQVFAQSADIDSGNKRDDDSKDMDALRRWLQDKRLVTMREIGGDLSLSGEIRSEFQVRSENKEDDDAEVRPLYAWDVEFNLMLDYHTDRTWAAVKLEYDNDMGQRSGTTNKIRLEKAYLGGRLVAGDTFTMDADIGRRNLSNVFDSKVQFSAIFDGGLLRFSKAFPTLADCYTNIGSFIVNDKTNHYGFVGEIGALSIANLGLNIKYSLIDWYRPGSETEKGNTDAENQLTNLRYRFLVSQFTTSYQFYPQWLGKRIIKFYGAALVNHLALDNPLEKAKVFGEPFGKKNWGWYTGVSIGLVKKKYDWAVDGNFQWVQAQAVPAYDANGIGRGNANDVGLYTAKNDGTGGPTTRATATGKGNYYGFAIDGLYAFTDNLTVNPNFQCSWTLDKDLGPNLVYKQFELEFIYAF